ncbi:sugar phosphate isomerase/epimerase [Porifericola rhodea]|uniref:sugar phosphate isomerase/epimerase family protein n=1 Tax=Porifericola rhodea TaxID=930972 RepID=UPI002665F136|nr:sugar phosphate isomerase/epimerase family protein [Porifericola rhodea]WKN30930.1 sugar phosphate isomerase/epimerase [Porifericola rhodea]
MKFGVSTFLWVSPFSNASFNLLSKVKEMGFDIIEIPVEDKDLIDWQRLKVMADELDLQLTISGAFGAERDISSDSPRIRKQGFNYIADCIRIAGQMNSPIFGGPLYAAVGKTRFVSEAQKAKEKDYCVAALKELGAIASDYGVELGVEPLNRFESDMINTADQALDLISEVAHSHVKIQLDTFHNNIEEKDIPATIRKLGKERLCHVQGNESDRGTPGTANVDWQGIKEALTDIDYQGAVVIETFGAVSEEIAKATCIWRPLANSSDELASEGLAFYKSLFNS